MNPVKNNSFRIARVFVCLALCTSSAARAQVVVTGREVPELTTFDNAMVAFMITNGIDRGVLAVSNNGCIVYQRGFNYPENTLFRLASVEKPITAAAVRTLYAGLDLDTIPVFNGGSAAFNNGGVLGHSPWQGNLGGCPWGSPCLESITVRHLIDHQGGWDRTNNGPGPCLGCTTCEGCSACQEDPQFAEIEIACTMEVVSPAGRDNTISYMLTQPLQFPPGGSASMACAQPVTSAGGTGCYSNFGYMLLGMIIETVTGGQHVDFIRQNVLTPALWVPATDILPGRTYLNEHDDREPNYVCQPACNCANIVDPEGDPVSCPYGGWHQEAFIGHGNLVAGAAPLLVFMDNYQVANGGISGTPLLGTAPSGCGPMGNLPCAHNGAFEGANTIMWQRQDGINIVVLFNQAASDSETHYGDAMAQTIDTQINNLLAGGFVWPTLCVDGFWVDFDSPIPSFYGAYDQPFTGMEDALGYIAAGSKLRLQPGTSSWTGTLATRMRLDAPFGTATIGRQ